MPSLHLHIYVPITRKDSTESHIMSVAIVSSFSLLVSLSWELLRGCPHLRRCRFFIDQIKMSISVLFYNSYGKERQMRTEGTSFTDLLRKRNCIYIGRIREHCVRTFSERKWRDCLMTLMRVLFNSSEAMSMCSYSNSRIQSYARFDDGLPNYYSNSQSQCITIHSIPNPSQSQRIRTHYLASFDIYE